MVAVLLFSYLFGSDVSFRTDTEAGFENGDSIPPCCEGLERFEAKQVSCRRAWDQTRVSTGLAPDDLGVNLRVLDAILCSAIEAHHCRLNSTYSSAGYVISS